MFLDLAGRGQLNVPAPSESLLPDLHGSVSASVSSGAGAPLPRAGIVRTPPSVTWVTVS